MDNGGQNRPSSFFADLFTSLHSAGGGVTLQLVSLPFNQLQLLPDLIPTPLMFMILEMILRIESSPRASIWLPAMHLITLLIEVYDNQPGLYAFASWPTLLPVLGALVSCSKMLRVDRRVGLASHAIAVKLLLLLASMAFAISSKLAYLRLMALNGMISPENEEVGAAMVGYLQQRQQGQQQQGREQQQQGQQQQQGRQHGQQQLQKLEQQE